MTTCETFVDHEWGRRKFLEAGRHPTMGRFVKYTVRCEKCGKETTETEWGELSAYVWPSAHRRTADVEA